MAINTVNGAESFALRMERVLLAGHNHEPVAVGGQQPSKCLADSTRCAGYEGRARCCHQSGELSCLRGTRFSRFAASTSSERETTRRVSAGSITASMYPRSAAMYGFKRRAV